MKTIELYAITRNMDQTEGRGPIQDLYYTTDKELALKIVGHPSFYGKYGVMGTAGGVHDVINKNLIVLETFSDFAKIENLTKVNAALSKLTADEKTLLGL